MDHQQPHVLILSGEGVTRVTGEVYIIDLAEAADGTVEFLHDPITGAEFPHIRDDRLRLRGRCVWHEDSATLIIGEHAVDLPGRVVLAAYLDPRGHE
jgi:hypothetical protein